MKTFMRAALLALVLGGFLTASAGAATLSPSLLVVNGTASNLTSYPLSAHDDARPTATVTADSTRRLHSPEGVAHRPAPGHVPLQPLVAQVRLV